MRSHNIFLFVAVLFVFLISGCENGEKTIFYDDFSQVQRGQYSVPVGAHTEYHYLHEAAPKGKWEVSTYRYDVPFMLVWKVETNEAGKAQMVSDYVNPNPQCIPMLCAGNRFWGDYQLEVNLELENDDQISGIITRYQNDRCHYVFCLHKGKAQILYYNQAKAFRQPYKEVLAEENVQVDFSKPIDMKFSVKGNKLKGEVQDVIVEAVDDRYRVGKVALMSNGPVKYNWARVTAGSEEIAACAQRESEYNKEVETARVGVPQMKLWKKLTTLEFGVGRNFRFGDLNNDGETDILVVQVKRHGPRDANSEVGCMTAITIDGEILWQLGVPDRDNGELSNDVGVQIHDIDNDGKNEVIYCKDFKIIVAEGSTGKTLRSVPTPLVKDKIPGERQNKFDRILGDCLYFCDLSGQGYDGDIIIKDRYKRVWAYDNNLNPLWYNFLNTGHYPYAYDTDNDGKDELAIGYSLIDDDGSVLWSLDNELEDHTDGVAIVKYKENEEPVLMCAASDEGMFFTDMKGNMLKHHFLGHVQNPVVANFRDDLPGLETVSVNFWGNQGILNYYDANGDVYLTVEPNQYGSMCLPLNWTGKTEEFFVLNANVDEGGVYDGWGRRVLDFPNDGHPDMCNAVLDLTGDCRDEIVVWDHFAVWIYTQEDNPKAGNLYHPRRNPLYNYSNYQATVSLP